MGKTISEIIKQRRDDFRSDDITQRRRLDRKVSQDSRVIETNIGDVEETDPEKAADYDAILVGSSNHFGGPVGGIKSFIDKLGELDLKAKWIAVFDTYEEKDYEKAVKKMEKRIGEKVPALKLIAPGLSIKVDGTQGPITDGELLKCKEFGKKIADQLKA